MELHDIKLVEFLNRRQQLYAPPYQRNYSWKAEDQCKQLWEDICMLIGKTKKLHFIGSVVVVEDDGYKIGTKQVSLVDGQQRITTFTLMLLALRMFCQEKGTLSSYDGVFADYLFNNNTADEVRIKLNLNPSDQTALEHLLNGGSIKPRSNSLIFKNTQYFLDIFRKQNIQPDAVLSALGCIQLVHVTLDSKDHPQRIFDNLNSTGQDLKPADMVRNFFLMSINPELQDTIYEKYWLPTEKLFDPISRAEDLNSLLTCFLRINVAEEISPEKLFEQFKAMHRKCLKTNEDLAAELYRTGKFFKDLQSINDPGYQTQFDYTDKVRCVLSEIPYLSTKIFHPIFIRLLDLLDQGSIDEKTFIRAARIIISYVIRVKVCSSRVNSSAYNDVLVALSKNFDNNDIENSLKKVFLSLANYAHFVTDDEFIEELKVKALYKTPIAKYMLAMLESRKPPIYYPTMTIEHIMPQNKNLSVEWQEALGPNWKTIQREMIHNLGNLTLTSYNSELGDKPFADKVQQYQRSKMHNLNKYLVQQSTWNLSLIEERSNLLIKECLTIWPYPTIEAE